MRAKENPKFPKPGSSDIVQLWKRDAKGRYANIASNFAIAEPPGLLSGGILADDMGLGKTLQMISLIMDGKHNAPTLVVAPVTVMSNWAQQIQRHVHPDKAPSVLIYHGSNKLPGKLNGYRVVITSYGKLSSEHKGGAKKPLMATNWRRVILDEGHTIRNAATEMAASACALKAQSRWVVTGTPMYALPLASHSLVLLTTSSVNNIKDLHSMVKFLRITGGLEQIELFNAVITRPLALGQQRAELLLQNLMQDLCLRRRKDMKFVDLNIPPKTEYIHRITFRPDEKSKYDALL